MKKKINLHKMDPPPHPDRLQYGYLPHWKRPDPADKIEGNLAYLNDLARTEISRRKRKERIIEVMDINTSLENTKIPKC